VKLRRADGSRAGVAASGAGEPTVGRIGQTTGDTVHFDIIDKDGNMISATPSGGWLQSVAGHPRTRLPAGHARPDVLAGGRPSGLAGAGQAAAQHAVAHHGPSRRQAVLAWGSPGGDQQDQWITQMFLRHVHCDMNLQEAIDAPAWHSEHFPSSFWPRTARPGVLVLEGRMPKDTVAELKKRGHEVEVNDEWSEGRLTAATRDDPWRKAAPPIRAACRATRRAAERT
jgi:gamma-glutamyltranspeptidase/glutathione hydrolase